MNDIVLAIGPANYAGQADAWARAVREHTPARAWSFSRGAPGRLVTRLGLAGVGFDLPADKVIPAEIFHLPVAHDVRSRWLLRGTTHVALDGFQPLFRLRREGKLAIDLHQLGAAGKKVALIAHGTDVRDPSGHIERNGASSYFNEGDQQWRDRLTRQTAANRDLAQWSGLPVFYSTPDLAFDLPFGTWLPVCLDPSAWVSDAPVLEREVPKVLHLPSRRNPPIKGTRFIDPALRRLHDAGKIEYLAPEHMPHAELASLIKSVDVVVDQVLFESYGVAAIEAMAAGRLVVGNMAPAVRASMDQAPPLVDAAPDQVEAVLEEILADRNRFARQAAEGPAFVRTWHDGRASARALEPFLGLG